MENIYNISNIKLPDAKLSKYTWNLPSGCTHDWSANRDRKRDRISLADSSFCFLLGRTMGELVREVSI